MGRIPYYLLMEKKFILCLALLSLIAVSSFAQIQSATTFFNSISDFYEKLRTYEVNVSVSMPERNMNGKVSFARPQMLRIDFTTPKGQVVLFDGNELIIYLPSQETILQQNVTSKDDQVSARGLTLLRRYYSVAFEHGPEAVPLDEGSSLKVVNLILTRRSATEAFTTIKLSVDPNSKLIRRAIATTPQGKVYTFTFSNWVLNPEMTEQRFLYDQSSSANSYNNFLFQE